VTPADAPGVAPPEFRPHAFGKFFLLQRLAAGGMAEIFRAKVVGAGGFEKELVLKRILPARSQDQQFIRMLVNEAKLTVQLTHGNIAQIYECGAVDGVYFIAMELVHGASLREVLGAVRGAGALTSEEAIYLVVQLLQGLSYAHRKADGAGVPLQVVHCDVSPDNVLVTWEGEVKLLDFGIARAATGISNYKDGVLMGKLGYVAPEQASLERSWDHRVDLFAAGVLLYELLTGRKPFPQAEDPDGLLAARRAPVPPPSSFDARLPPEVDSILARALAFDPDHRYPDARAFAEALVDVLFPTPHSAIQESLSVRMKAAFAERIGRERSARAHDALVVKVLENAQRAAEPGPVGSPPPRELGDELTAVERTIPVRAAPSRRAPPPRRRAWPGALALALAAAAGAGGTWALGRARAEGVLLVTSEPPGASVTLDGEAVAGTTPLVIERLLLSGPHVVRVSAPDRLATTLEVPAEQRPFRRLHARLEESLVTVRIESAPTGAAVRLDGRPAGATPLAVRVRADERHRFDLSLPGHELDQFIVLPERDGTHFQRALTGIPPADRKGAGTGRPVSAR
jgi:hypothetical protein